MMIIRETNNLRRYSGHPPWVQGELQTCRAFLTILEDNVNNVDIVKAFSENLEGAALDWFMNIGDIQDWQWIKNEFIAKFGVDINLLDKLHIRKSLHQMESESVQEFFERCVLAQFAITDDDECTSWNDPVFERDVALNFLLGMRPEFQSQAIASQDKTLDGFHQKAIEAEKAIVIKKENVIEEKLEGETIVIKEEIVNGDEDTLPEFIDIAVSKSKKQRKQTLVIKEEYDDDPLEQSVEDSEFQPDEGMQRSVKHNKFRLF